MVDSKFETTPNLASCCRLSACTILLLLIHQGIAFTSASTGGTSGPPRLEPRNSLPRGGSAVVASPSVIEKTESSENAPRRGGGFIPTNSSFIHAREFLSRTDPAQSRGPLKVLFLSSDTGGGHRASAESLAKQFLMHYPGSKYDLLDVWTTANVYPFRTLVKAYKHLSHHPNQWRLLYHLSNSLPWEIYNDLHSTFTCEKIIRRNIELYKPDVIVSVHPTMNHAPRIAAQKISRETGKHIPFFTVVTDLGSGHCTWFQKKVDKLYLASERLFQLAKRRGGTPDDKIVMAGLPIRHEFAVQAHRMGCRTTPAGKEYQRHIRADVLNLNPDRPMILLMGGGEGVGSLSDIVDELYADLVHKGTDATICVVCGRNQKLQQSLKERDWEQVVQKLSAKEPNARRRKRRWWRRRHHNPLVATTNKGPSANRLGQVDVVGLGFVTNMAEYMVAADILVTKAGPGTIAEAASVGLPVMLTSFLPGQEAGNVDYVVEKGFGDFYDDPFDIADQVSGWLQVPKTLDEMSLRAQAVGHPDAAAEIVLDIGSTTHTWMALNGDPL